MFLKINWYLFLWLFKKRYYYVIKKKSQDHHFPNLCAIFLCRWCWNASKKITMTKYRSQILLTLSFLNTCGTIKIPLEFLLWPLYLYVEDTSSRNNYLKELYFQKKYKEKKRILYQLIYDHSFKSLAKL